MNILVAGAHGAIGQFLVRKLKLRGEEVTGLVRNESQAETLRKLGATPMVADLEAPDTLRGAVAYQDAVYFVAGSQGKSLEEVDKGGAIHLVKAANEIGTRRFIMLSSFYAGHPGKGPEQLRTYLQAKHDADVFLQKSGLDFTIVRPALLTNEGETGQIAISKFLDKPDATVSRADVAETLTMVLELPQTIGRTFEFESGHTPIQKALAQFE